MSIRVFLVDDEPVVRRGLEMLLSREPDLTVCGQAGTIGEALTRILAQPPDVAVIDLTLKQENGLDLARELRAFDPKPKIIIFSMHTQASHIRAAFKAGADGYVTKEEGSESLVDAIRIVMQGSSYLTEAVSSRLGSSAAALRAVPRDPPSH